jgi:hypothetical protein
MSKMKVFWIIGYEFWGKLKPSKMWNKKGQCFIPMFLGIWLRWPFFDKDYLNLAA